MILVFGVIIQRLIFLRIMRIERPKSETDSFWENFESEELVYGSDYYNAVKRLWEIESTIYLDNILNSSSKCTEVLDELLLKVQQEKIEMELKKNTDKPGVFDKLKDLLTMLNSTPDVDIHSRLKILENQIKKADSRTNLV